MAACRQEGEPSHSPVTSPPRPSTFLSPSFSREHIWFFCYRFFSSTPALLFRPLKVSESAETRGSKDEKGRAPFSQRAFITLYRPSCQNSSVPVSPLLNYKSSFVTVSLCGRRQALIGLLICILMWTVKYTAIVNTAEVKVILCPHPAFKNE